MSDVRRRLARFACLGDSLPIRGLTAAEIKTGVAAARSTMSPHLVAAAAAARDGNRIRFAARWLCGSGSIDAVPLPEMKDAADLCERCLDRRKDLDDGPICVYRCFDSASSLLYVGSTGNGARTRLEMHRRHASWWPQMARFVVEPFGSLEEARSAERRAIRGENPRHNIAGRRAGAA